MERTTTDGQTKDIIHIIKDINKDKDTVNKTDVHIWFFSQPRNKNTLTIELKIKTQRCWLTQTSVGFLIW